MAKTKSPPVEIHLGLGTAAEALSAHRLVAEI
jgi:hypothetical protein